MLSDKCVGPTSLGGRVGGTDGGMPALPTHSGQMVVSQGGRALPYAGAPLSLMHREEEINTSQDLLTPHTPCLNCYCHSQTGLGKYTKGTPALVPEIQAQSSGTLVLRFC